MLQLINNNLTTKSTEKPVLNLEGKTDVQELPSKSDYETENKVGKLESLEEGCLPEEIIVSKKKGGRKKKGSSLQKFLEGIKN